MFQEVKKAMSGKTVFVTGHTGFKGSWLSLWLNAMGAKVVGYSLDPPSSPNNFDLCHIGEIIDEHLHGDIRNAMHMEEAILKSQPDYVFHMAAQTVVKTGYEQPKETFDVNVVGTACLFDAIAKLEKSCTVICVTSDKCYANNETGLPFVEDDPMGEREPYGASKGCTELVAKAYTHSFFHPKKYDVHHKAIATARAGNVIGGGDWTPHALIPDLVEAAIANKSVELRNPLATRPWQHVLQTLSGYLLLAARLNSSPKQYSGGWNFGPLPETVHNVSEFADRFFAQWQSGSWKDVSDGNHVHEAQSLMLSIDKARKQLGWEPIWDTDKTTQMCVDWFKSFYKGAEPRQLCLEQIKEFESDWR